MDSIWYFTDEKSLFTWFNLDGKFFVDKALNEVSISLAELEELLKFDIYKEIE